VTNESILIAPAAIDTVHFSVSAHVGDGCVSESMRRFFRVRVWNVEPGPRDSRRQVELQHVSKTRRRTARGTQRSVWQIIIINTYIYIQGGPKK